MATDPARRAESLEHSRRRLTLVAMCIGQGMILLDNTIVNVALPAIQHGLGVTPGNLEWTVNALFLAISPFAGRIVKRYGMAWTNTMGFAIAGIATLGLGQLDVESSYAAVWPWYLLSGLGYGMLVPAVSSAAMSAVPADHSGAGSGILNSSRQIGAAVGLAVLGSLSVAAASRAWRASLGAFHEDAPRPRHSSSRSRAARDRQSRPPSGPPRSPRHSTPSSPATAWRSSSPASSSSLGPPSPSSACARGDSGSIWPLALGKLRTRRGTSRSGSPRRTWVYVEGCQGARNERSMARSKLTQCPRRG